MLLFHQHEGQIRDIAGAMKNAQTKIIFSTEESPKKQRHFTLRRANHETIEVEAPEVRDYKVSAERIEKYVEKLTQYFMTCEQVDERLNRSQNEINPPEEFDPDE